MTFATRQQAVDRANEGRQPFRRGGPLQRRWDDPRKRAARRRTNGTSAVDGFAEGIDGDRVLDGIDQCPDTPKGQKIDRDGCPRVRLDKGEPQTLQNVKFIKGELDTGFLEKNL